MMLKNTTLLLTALLFAGCGDDDKSDTGWGDSSSDSDAAGAASVAAGDYTGSITGPAMGTDYTITLTEVSANEVEVSGADFDSFTVPLGWDGNTVNQVSSWSDGNFVLDGDDLSLQYTPISLNFTGTRD